jgi:hypothetical protein
MPGTLEVKKLATSDGPLGTESGDQFKAVFQSLLTGEESHVALAPLSEETIGAKLNTTEQQIKKRRKNMDNSGAAVTEKIRGSVYIASSDKVKTIGWGSRDHGPLTRT